MPPVTIFVDIPSPRTVLIHITRRHHRLDRFRSQDVRSSRRTSHKEEKLNEVRGTCYPATSRIHPLNIYAIRLFSILSVVNHFMLSGLLLCITRDLHISDATGIEDRSLYVGVIGLRGS